MTGSDSIDTLVRVGLTKASGLKPTARRVVIQDFTACGREELTVRRGDVVYIVYRDHEWFYVSTPGGRTGYIPVTFCGKGKSVPSDDVLEHSCHIPSRGRIPADPTPLNESTAHLSLRTKEENARHLPDCQALHATDIELQSKQCRGYNHGYNEIFPFKKEERGHSMVLFEFGAKNENDLDVRRGEIVVRLNEEDREWVWVRRGDNVEGFVPYNYLCPLSY
ncbi:SH3 domain-containing protein Dlish-like [Liolophura sinensis]|uniref:SH3 domain-containing protein Dlish-like n=1 Tax=Liolophura sinensis TaxID=3198878 RepID=UPI003158920C